MESAADLPAGEYGIVEIMGHSTLVGLIEEVERFGTKMLAIRPLFKRELLPVVFQGGQSIYRLTPCSAAIAWERQPNQDYQLPPSIRCIVPAALIAGPIATVAEDPDFREVEDALGVEGDLDEETF